jgi:hypothetical protein
MFGFKIIRKTTYREQVTEAFLAGISSASAHWSARCEQAEKALLFAAQERDEARDQLEMADQALVTLGADSSKRISDLEREIDDAEFNR